MSLMRMKCGLQLISGFWCVSYVHGVNVRAEPKLDAQVCTPRADRVRIETELACGPTAQILAHLDRGAVIKELEKQGDW